MDRTAVSLPDFVPVVPQGERRRSLRQKLHTPVFVSFNGPQSGMVVDLSELLDLHENGFAVQTAIPTGLQRSQRLEVNHAVTLCLELAETKKYVHGSGQVMWTDNTGRAGIRFSFLPDGSRQILKEWLFANLLVASTNHATRAEQVARRRKEESSLQESPSPDLSPSAQPPVMTSNPVVEPVVQATAPAPVDRDDLLSALDQVRRVVRQIQSRGGESRAVETPPGQALPAVVQPSEVRGLDPVSDTDSILEFITRCALNLTGATGAAMALRTAERTVCRARAGNPAPPIGSEVDVQAGLSGECVRNGVLVSCADPETDPRVDAEVCRMLGIGSLVAAPVFGTSGVIGLLEIFSPYPQSFAEIHGTILQRLAQLVSEIEDHPIEDGPLPPDTGGTTTIEPKMHQGSTERASADGGTTGRDVAKQSSAERWDRPESRPPNPLSLNSPDAPVGPPADMPPASVLKLSGSEQQMPESPVTMPDAKLQASGRRPYFIQIALLLLVLGMIALVMGYVLAPTIQRRWLPQSSQNSRPTAEQASSFSLRNASDQRNRKLSPDDLKKLGQQGDADAQYQLGILYHDGDTVPRNDEQAVQWFRRAAEQGYVRAQSTLGAYYWAGRGVPQDYTKAYFWSQLALAQGDENSKSRLEGLSAQMTQSQVSSARQLAEAWLHSRTQAKPNPGSR